MKSIHVVVFFFAAAILSGEDLRVDTEELQSALKEGIVFENYEGVPEKIETVSQIRSIGTALAGDGGRTSTGKYTVIRAADPSTPIGLDADIFILEPAASVDHIRNLRWIIGSYLESQYGYGRADADLLAQFITIYNAVYRKNLSYFNDRYKPVVLSYLDPAKVGLARTYKEWPGKTQMLIPLSGPKKRGILAIETGALTEKPVVEELRKEEDRGIPLRKEMVELKERQLKEEERQLEEEKKALLLEKEKQKTEPTPFAPSKEARDGKEGISAVPPESRPSREPSTDTGLSVPVKPEALPADAPSAREPLSSAPPPTSSPQTPPPSSQSIESPQGIEGKRASDVPPESSSAQQQTQTSLAAKEEDLKEREKQLQEKQQALREERIAIAKDQQELLESKAREVSKTLPFLFMEKEGPRLVLLEENSGSILVRSSEFPLKQSLFQPFGGGYLVILPRTQVGGRLALLDPASLQVRVTSREEVYGLGKVRVHESICFTIIREGNDWFVGRFDTALALLARSRIAVHPETDLVIQGGKLYVQTTDGKVDVLSLELSSP